MVASGGDEMTDIEIPEGFTRWDGGECPVDPEMGVAYVMRDGGASVHGEKAKYLVWAHPAYEYDGADIIAYRVLP